VRRGGEREVEATVPDEALTARDPHGSLAHGDLFDPRLRTAGRAIAWPRGPAPAFELVGGRCVRGEVPGDDRGDEAQGAHFDPPLAQERPPRDLDVYLAYTQEITTGGAFDAKTVELDAQRGPQVNIHPSCRHGSSRATTEGLQLTREEALALIDRIPQMTAQVYENSNLRFLNEHYQQCIQDYTCADLLQLIKDVRAKRRRMAERGKKLGLVDERYMKRAEEMLHGELAIALDMPREQVPQFISDTLGDAGEPEAALA
jgi:hypothetical protein